MFERKLKELNPTIQDLKYDIPSLYSYIDKLVRDLLLSSALVLHMAGGARRWIRRAAPPPCPPLASLYLRVLLWCSHSQLVHARSLSPCATLEAGDVSPRVPCRYLRGSHTLLS